MILNKWVLVGKFYFLIKSKTNSDYSACICRPCRRSKVELMEIDGVADSDEDISLNNQLNDGDSF